MTEYNKELIEELKIIQENDFNIDSNKDDIKESKKDDIESFLLKSSKEILADEEEIK